MLLKDQSSQAMIAGNCGQKWSPALLRKAQVIAVKSGAEFLPERIEGIQKQKWQSFRDAVRIPHLRIIDKVTSSYDGFSKYLFEGEGAGQFEAVRIPLLHRPGDEKYVVCVSSQVGCAAGCAFCATGRMGFKRHLETWEIVDQIIKIQADSSYPVRGVVFMGMGEPFLNYGRVLRAAEVISDSCGLAIEAKAVTISTVGVVPMIERFTRERRRQRLIVSLTSAIDAKRDLLLPMNQNYPIRRIIDALKLYQQQSRRRVTFAWTMIKGVNMDAEEVEALAAISQELKMILDVIPVNDNTGRFFPPSDQEYQDFLKMLSQRVKCPIVRRYSGGADVQAACGMLAATQGVGGVQQVPH